MQRFALVGGLVAALLPLGGCMGGGDDGGSDAPKTYEFNLVVHPNASDTIELYEKNDGSYSKAIAITFKASPDDPQTLPGPEIRVKEGDTVILHLSNLNGLMHTLHLHGGLVPWEQDGVDYLTQNPILQGEEYTYTFENLKAGTYWYHCHVDGAHHIDFGMYGAFIVEERRPTYKADRDYVVVLDEYDNCHVHGNNEPLLGQEPTPDTQDQAQCVYRFLMDNLAQNRLLSTTGNQVNNSVPDTVSDAYCPVLQTALSGAPAQYRDNVLLIAGCLPAHEHGSPPPQQVPRSWWPVTHPVYNPVYNTFLVNGKAFPDTPVFPVKEGETVRFRIINAGSELHTWHPHGHTMLITHKDGYELPNPYRADTLAIAPGERYDYVMKFDNPGLWMIHDQNGMATVNDNVHPGGMMACMAYDGFRGIDAFAMQRALDCNTEAIKILGEHQHGGAETQTGVPASEAATVVDAAASS